MKTDEVDFREWAEETYHVSIERVYESTPPTLGLPVRYIFAQLNPTIPIFGQSDSQDESVVYLYKPELITDPKLITYTIAHEIGHLLDKRDGLQAYQIPKFWLTSRDIYDTEVFAWERAEEIMTAYYGSDWRSPRLNAFRKAALESYAKDLF